MFFQRNTLIFCWKLKSEYQSYCVMEIKRMNKFIKALLISILTFEDNPSLSCTPKDKDHWNDQAPLQLPNELTCPLNGKGPFQVTWDRICNIWMYDQHLRGNKKWNRIMNATDLRRCQLPTFLVLPTLVIVFSFASHNISVIFQCFTGNRGRNTARFSFKFLEFCFNYIFFFMLKGRRETISKGSIYNLHPLSLCMCRV